MESYNKNQKYEVTINVKGLGIMVKEIEALSLLAAQGMVLADWKVKISQILNRKNYTQSFDETIRSLRMTMLDKWEIVIVEK